jgi:hypothetical protein
MLTPGILSITTATLVVFASASQAQGSAVSGRVLSDSGVALAGAEVVLNGPQNAQRTNARGEFRFTAVSGGSHVVGVRMPGFAPHVDTIEVPDAGEMRHDVRLARIEATLPEVPVTASLLDRKLVEFHERRRMGIGRFLDSAEFANSRGTRTSDRLSRLPGLKIQRGRFLSEAYVISTRETGSLSGVNPVGCRSAVWLDGVNLWTDFSVNQLDPSVIAAVEWYAGPASLPAKYNVTPSSPRMKYCGVLVIWTR